MLFLPRWGLEFSTLHMLRFPFYCFCVQDTCLYQGDVRCKVLSLICILLKRSLLMIRISLLHQSHYIKDLGELSI